MKKMFFTALSFFAIFSATAQNANDYLTRVNTDLIRNKLSSKDRYEKAVGSPYILEKFNLASISGVQNSVLVRYNAEADEMEIDNGDEKIYILPKSNEYNTITLKNGMYKYILTSYKDAKGLDSHGYLVEEFSENGLTLLKKEKVNFKKGKEAENSYAQDSPSKLVRAKDEFYFKNKEGQVAAFPTSKKEIIALYPSKKAEIEKFLKENDPSFKKEDDLVKVAKFISTL